IARSSRLLPPSSALDSWMTCVSDSKPYIEKWDKPGMTSDTRDQDSANCGGGSGSHAPGFSQKRINEEKRPGEKESSAYARLFYNWERCMIKKGYRFTGECYNNEISRASPACGAP
ncbi:hypothetical protein, partial [Ralstonia solanacearum]